MNYAYKHYTESMARASGRDLGISIKQSIEITRELRGKPVDRAKAVLEDAISMKKPIPFKRFMNGVGHKPGMAAGRYPQKACKEILAVLVAAEANAQNKGLGACKIVHCVAQQAATPFHYGRRRRIRTRRAHIEIVLQETEPAKKDKKGRIIKETQKESKETGTQEVMKAAAAATAEKTEARVEKTPEKTPARSPAKQKAQKSKKETGQ